MGKIMPQEKGKNIFVENIRNEKFQKDWAQTNSKDRFK